MMDPDDLTNPTDTSLLAVTRRLEELGHTGQFQSLEGGTVRCLTCREDFAASRVDADELTRLEGASDPADMAAVIPLHCPHCDTAGVLIVHYGPEASAADADVLADIDREPAEPDSDSAFPGATPGIR